jgi:DNA primase
VLVLPGGTDPDDIVRDRGPEAFHDLLRTPSSLMDFLLAALPEDPGERRRNGLRLAPLVCAAADPATRQNLVEELARRLYLRPRDIEERGRAPARNQRVPSSSSAPADIASGERQLARILIECDQHSRDRIVQVVNVEQIADSRVRRLLEAAAQLGEDPAGAPEAAVRKLLDLCSDQAVETFVAELSNSDWPELTQESIRALVRLIIDRQNRELARRLEPMIASAEARGDYDEVSRLQAEKVRLRQNTVEF